MPQFKSYNYSNKAITASVRDSNNGEFIWIAFDLDPLTNTCGLLKLDAFDPSKILFTVSVPVQRINAMAVSGTSLVLGVSDSINLLYRYNTANPNSATLRVRPLNITEDVLEVASGGGFLWWLLPGVASAENAKIIKTSSNGSILSTIDLSVSGDVVLNAKGLAYSAGDLWVATFTDPVQLWRVFDIGGGVWDLRQNNIV